MITGRKWASGSEKTKVLWNCDQCDQFLFRIFNTDHNLQGKYYNICFTLSSPVLGYGNNGIANSAHFTWFPSETRVIWRGLNSPLSPDRKKHLGFKATKLLLENHFPKGQRCIWLLLRTIFSSDKWQFFGTVSNIGTYINMFSCMMKNKAININCL